MLLQLLILEVGNCNYSWNRITVNEFLLHLLKVWMLCVVFCVIGVCSVVPPLWMAYGWQDITMCTCIYRSWSSRYRLLNDSKRIKPIFFFQIIAVCTFILLPFTFVPRPLIMSWSNSVSWAGNSCNVWCIPMWTAMQMWKHCYGKLFQWRFVAVV